MCHINEKSLYRVWHEIGWFGSSSLTITWTSGPKCHNGSEILNFSKNILEKSQKFLISDFLKVWALRHCFRLEGFWHQCCLKSTENRHHKKFLKFFQRKWCLFSSETNWIKSCDVHSVSFGTKLRHANF